MQNLKKDVDQMTNNQNKPAAFEGYETFINNLLMSSKMWKDVFLLCLTLQAVFFILICYVFSSAKQIEYFLTWIVSKFYSLFFLPDKLVTISFPSGKSYVLAAYQMQEVVWPFVTRNWYNYFLFFIGSCSIWFVFPYILNFFSDRSEKQSEKSWIKGSKLVTPEEMEQALKKNGEEVDLRFGQIRQPVNYETTHTFFGGTTGSGKTVFLLPVIERVIERGDRAIIYDNKGDFVPKFFDPERDFLFNPLDQRCCGWNIFNDINSVMDIEAIATSLIPPAMQADPYWNDAARDVFSGILQYCWINNLKTNKDVWKLVSTDVRTLSNLMKDTPGAEAAYIAIQDGSSKQAMSVISVMMRFAKAFKYLASIEGDFSIKKHLEEGKGNVFVTNFEEVEDTLRPILSLFIDTLGRRLLSLSIDGQRRIFFFLDELGTLQKLSTIIKMLTLSRDKGGACYLGIQNAGWLSQIYGKEGRETIVNCCNSTVFFRFNDPDSQQYVSKTFGDTVFLQVKKSDSMGVAENRDGKSISYEEKTEPLIIPSELKNLQTLTGYVSFSGYHTTKVRFTPKDYQEKQARMILFDHLLLETIREEQENNLNEITSLPTNSDVSWTGTKKMIEQKQKAHPKEKKQRPKIMLNCNKSYCLKSTEGHENEK